MPIDASIPLQVRPGPAIDPASALAQVMQLKQLEQQGQAQQQASVLRDQQIENEKLSIAAKQRTQAGQTALAAAIKDPANRTPDGAVNHEQIATRLSEQFPDVAEAWLKQTSANAEALEKVRATTRAHAEAAQEAIGSLAASSTNAREFEASLGLLASQGIIDEPTATKIAQDAEAAGPDGWKAIRDQYVHLSPTMRKAAITAETPAGLKATADLAKTEAETKKLQAEVAGTLPQTPAQVETTRHNQEMEKIGRLSVGRAEASAAEVARHNRAMEDSARMTKTARPVIACDAEDLANFDTSLDDLKVLKNTITNATGTSAAIGAALPNWVTNVTGWGTDAKKKQALIDRVKQVIGKTLEGGVLRKEDELKYEKILPTVGDAPAIVQSKLEGLDAAITKRKSRRLEALEDAGFNVEKYKARAPDTTPPVQPVDAPKGPPIGTPGTINGQSAVWKTVNGITGWYAR